MFMMKDHAARAAEATEAGCEDPSLCEGPSWSDCWTEECVAQRQSWCQRGTRG